MKHIKLFEQFIRESGPVDIEVFNASHNGWKIAKYDDATINKYTPYWAVGFDYMVTGLDTFPNDKQGNIVTVEDAYSDEVLQYAAEEASSQAGVKLKVKNGGLYSNKVKGEAMSFEFKRGQWIGTRKAGLIERGGPMDLYQFIEQFVALSVKLQER